MDYLLLVIISLWLVDAAVDYRWRKKMGAPTAQLINQHGWAVCVYPTDNEIALNVGTKGSEDLELLNAIACTALAGTLRDNHPDPIVADKAADLILALHTHTRTVARVRQ